MLALVSLSLKLFYEEEWVSPTQNSHTLIPDTFSSSALLKKIQPTLKSSTWIKGSSQGSCEFATPKHVLQRGSKQHLPHLRAEGNVTEGHIAGHSASVTASVILLGDILSVAEGGDSFSAFSIPLRLLLQLAIMRCDSLPKEGQQDGC